MAGGRYLLWGHVRMARNFPVISKNTPCSLKQGSGPCQRYLAFCLLGRVQGMAPRSKDTFVVRGTVHCFVREFLLRRVMGRVGLRFLSIDPRSCPLAQAIACVPRRPPCPGLCGSGSSSQGRCVLAVGLSAAPQEAQGHLPGSWGLFATTGSLPSP